MKNKRILTTAITFAIAMSASSANASLWQQTVDMSKKAYVNVASFWNTYSVDENRSEKEIPSEMVSVESALIEKIKEDRKSGIVKSNEEHLVDLLESAIARQDADEYYSYAEVSKFGFLLADKQELRVGKETIKFPEFMRHMHFRAADEKASGDFQIELNQFISHLVSKTKYADLYSGRLAITDMGTLLIQSDDLYKLNRIDLSNGLETFHNMQQNKMAVGPDGFPIQICRMANNDQAVFIEIAYTDIENLMDIVHLPEEHRGACVTRESLEEIGYAKDRVGDLVTPLGHWRR